MCKFSYGTRLSQSVTRGRAMGTILGRWASLVFLLSPVLGCIAPSVSSPCKPLEDALLFHPVRYPLGDWQAEDLVHEDAWFKAEDGTLLHGWFCPAANPRAVALFCH